MLLLERMRQAKEQSGVKAWHVGLGLLLTAVVVLAVLYFTGVIGAEALTGSQQMSLKISRPRSLGTADDIHHLHISEIEVYKKSDGSKLAISCANPCINPMGEHPGAEAIKAFDGDVTTTYHNRYVGQYDENNPFYGTEDHFLHVNIAGVSSKNEISKIKIVHKHPQTRRIVGAGIELLSNGTSVWNATFADPKEEYEFTVV